MRVAIIGLPGTGRTTLAAVLGRELGVTTVDSLDELPALIAGGRSFVLDGLPRTPGELRQIESLDPAGSVLDHVVCLEATPEARAKRLAVSVSAGRDEACVDDQHATSRDLDEICEQLGAAGILTKVDAEGSAYKVMALAFEALRIRI